MWQPIRNDLAVAHDDIRFLELHAAGTDRLDLPAFQRQAGFEALLDEVVVKRLAVLDDAHRRKKVPGSEWPGAQGARIVAAWLANRTHGARERSAMALVERSVLVSYSAERMYELVDDVERYPEFLPWCGGTQVELRDAEVTRASIRIDYHGIKQSFKTENRTEPPQLIEIRLVSGPFRAARRPVAFHTARPPTPARSSSGCTTSSRTVCWKRWSARSSNTSPARCSRHSCSAPSRLYGQMTADDIEIEVVYALPLAQEITRLRVPAGTTVAEAIERSGIRRRPSARRGRPEAVGYSGTPRQARYSLARR